MQETLLKLILAVILTITTLQSREVSLENKISSLYISFFNRAADEGGLTYWNSLGVAAELKGEDLLNVLNQLAAGFAEHPTFTSTYSSMGNEAFVEAIYKNSLGRAGDADGVAYWKDLLNNGQSRSDMVAKFMNLSLTLDLTVANFPDLSAEDLAAAVERQDLITNKVDVAVYFTKELGIKTNVADIQDPENDSAYLASIRVLSEVTIDNATVTTATSRIDNIKNNTNPISEINAQWSSLSNSLPIANAGVDQDSNTNTLVSLDGSASSDADQDTLIYSWSITTKPSASTTSLSSSLVNPTFTPDLDGTYIASLIVNDGTVDSILDRVTITATTPNLISFSGVAVDGYISGASACLDLNINGVCDSGEPTTITLADGTFTFTDVEVPTGQLLPVIVSGGIDTATNEPFSGELKNIVDSEAIESGEPLIVTPLTDLFACSFISSDDQSPESLNNMKTDVATAVGLSLDKVDADPMVDPEVFASAQVIQQTKELLLTSLAKANNTTDENSQEYQDLARTITQAIASSIEDINVIEVNIDTVVENIENNIPSVVIPENEKTFIDFQLVEIKAAMDQLSRTTTSMTIEELEAQQRDLETKVDQAKSNIEESTTDTIIVIVTVKEKDDDQDGFVQSVDCNDNNSLINPDVQELLDGLDNDCDSEIDEGFTFSWNISEWGECIGTCGTDNSLQTRTTTCLSSIGTTVDDVQCTDTKPTLIQTCTSFLCNVAPVANAGADKTVQEGAYVTLSAAASTDSDGIITSYYWKEGSTVLSTTSSFRKSNLSVGTHTLILTVTDNDGATHTNTVVISVNAAPIANAGVDQNVATNTLVTLDASSSSDENEDTLTYNWRITAKPSGSNTSLLSFSVVHPTFTPDVDGNYAVRLVVNDGKVDSIQDRVIITATTPNVKPVANAGGDQIVTQGDRVIFSAAASTDSDGTITNYAWSEGTTPLSKASTFSKSNLSTGTHTIILTVTDNDGASSTDSVVINVNVAPVANAGADQAFTQGGEVTISAAASTDSDGRIVSYSWSEGNVVLSTASSFSKADFIRGTHIITLTVTDNNGATSSDKIVISVNEAPIAKAGIDQGVIEGDQVTLVSASTDSYGKIVSYSWSEGATILSTAFSFTKTDFSAGTHTIILTVTDNDGASSTDSVVINVNVAPVANAGADQAFTQGDEVTISAAASTDSDGRIVSYSWSEGKTVLSTSASFSKSDFSAGSHTITLIVTDNDGATATDTIIINVNAIPVANAGVDQSVHTIVNIDFEHIALDASTSSDIDSDLLTYFWSMVSKPIGSVATLSSITSVNPTFAADIDGEYIFSLVVNDGLVDSAADTIKVVAQTDNSAPIANAGINQYITTGSIVQLNADQSTDADLDTLSYIWSFTQKPIGSNATLSNVNIVNPLFTADVNGLYTLTLVVNDTQIDSAEDSIEINATTLNSAPVANAGVNQNVATDILITLNGSQSSDSDEDVLQYNWSFSSKPQGSTATLSFATSVNPIFTADVDGDYVIQLIVNDGTVDSTLHDSVILTANTASVITTSNPTHQTLDVDPNIVLSVSFSLEMDSTTINTNSVILKDRDDNTVQCSVAYANKTLTCTPLVSLFENSVYILNILNSIKDIHNFTLAQSSAIQFKTGENILSTLSFDTTKGMGELNVAYNGITPAKVSFTLVEGSYILYSEIADADSIKVVNMGQLNNELGVSQEDDITGVKVTQTSDVQPAHIEITNSSGANKTYTMELTSEHLYSGNTLSANIWFGIVKDGTPAYSLGGTLNLGDVSTNKAEILAINEMHQWIATLPSDGDGLYTLKIETDDSINFLKQYNLQMISNGTGQQIVDSAVTNGNFLQENIELDASGQYFIIIESPIFIQDPLGHYTVKLIKQ